MKAEPIGPPPWKSAARRALKQIGPIRLAGTILFLLVSLAFARFGWSIPLASDAERALYDIRSTIAAPKVGQDDRIVLVVYNDQTLEKLGKRSPLDRKMLAEALRTIDAMNPRAIGIDILFDQAQPEDPILLDTFHRMRAATYVAFATNATNPNYMEYWQEQFLRNFLKQTAPGPVQPASILLEPDLEDNVIRSWPSQPPSLPPLLANALAPIHPEFRQYTRSIEFRCPRLQTRRFSPRSRSRVSPKIGRPR